MIAPAATIRGRRLRSRRPKSSTAHRSQHKAQAQEGKNRRALHGLLHQYKGAAQMRVTSTASHPPRARHSRVTATVVGETMLATVERPPTPERGTEYLGTVSLSTLHSRRLLCSSSRTVA